MAKSVQRTTNHNMLFSNKNKRITQWHAHVHKCRVRNPDPLVLTFVHSQKLKTTESLLVVAALL